MAGKTKKRNSKKVHFNSRVTVHKIEKNNATDFENQVKGMYGTILFHHPGCVHCVMLRPKWNQMIQQLKNKNIQCRVLEVNAEALPMIHHPLGKVDGFPRIVNVQNGVEHDVFGDERNVANMLNFVINNLKGKQLSYDYNLNEKNNLVKLTDPNNLKRVRNPKKRKNKKTRKNNKNKKIIT